MKKYLSLLLLIVGLGALLTSNETQGAAQPLKDWEVKPSYAAVSQTLTIEVEGEAEPNPVIIWNQEDSGAFVANSSLMTARAANGGTGPAPYPQDSPWMVPFNTILNMDNYIPYNFKDKRDNLYHRNTITNYELYEPKLQIKPSQFGVGYAKTSYGEPTVHSDKKSINLWIATGGPNFSGRTPTNGNTTAGFPKQSVRYELNLKVAWRGKLETKKTIRINPASLTLKKGTQGALRAEVNTEGYNATPWSNVTTYSTWTSTNTSVFTVDKGVIKAVDPGTAEVVVDWKSDDGLWHLTTRGTITVTNDDVPPGGGNGGSGQIIFTPDNSEQMEPPIVRGWARRNFPVTASVVGYEPVRYETTVSGTQEYDDTCSRPDGKGGTETYSCTKTRTVSVPYSWVQEADIGRIQISGSATGINTVTISTEGDNLQLQGRVDWLPGVETWNLPPRTTATKPTPPATPPPITGTSGIYKLDKQAPTQTVTPTSHGWTNQPITININHADNLSGFYKTYYSLTNISYYANGNLLENAPDLGRSWTPTITIAQQGVYVLKTQLGDFAGWPEVLPEGPREYQFVDYRYDSIPPYQTDYQVGSGGIYVNGTFDYIAGEDNNVQIRVGDELSGVVLTEFSWSKSPDRGSPHVNNWGGGWNTIPVTTPDYATGPNQMSNWVDVNVDSKTQYSQNQATSYADLKEGTWYLHVRQTDRANNVTHSVSPPIFINRLKNLRVWNISDFSWKNTFVTAGGSDTLVKVNGIGVNEMPIYWNKKHRNVSLGYGAEYKFDSVGFDGPNDKIVIKMTYHGMDENGNIYQDDDVYTETKSGDFVKLEDGEYASISDIVGFSRLTNSDKKKAYEDNIVLNQPIRPMYQEDTDKTRYSTYNNRTFLPPTTKFVKKGQKLDLVKKTNMQKYRELVSFTIEATREGHPRPLQYTFKEDMWSNSNVWGTNSYNSYGRNRPTGRDLLGLGRNKGEVIWYDLKKTLNDDLKYFREW